MEEVRNADVLNPSTNEMVAFAIFTILQTILGAVPDPYQIYMDSIKNKFKCSTPVAEYVMDIATRAMLTRNITRPVRELYDIYMSKIRTQTNGPRYGRNRIVKLWTIKPSWEENYEIGFQARMVEKLEELIDIRWHRFLQLEWVPKAMLIQKRADIEGLLEKCKSAERCKTLLSQTLTNYQNVHGYRHGRQMFFGIIRALQMKYRLVMKKYLTDSTIRSLFLLKRS